MVDQLLPHQKVAADFLAARGPALLWDEPGLGKTYSSVAAADQTGCRKILVSCPAAVRPHWAREFMNRQTIQRDVTIVEGNPKTPPSNTGVTIVSHAAFSSESALDVLRQGQPYDAFIIDECFPWETLINTDRGKLSIGTIVTAKMNVKVLSFNVSSGNMEWKPVVRWLRKATETKMVRITHERGSFDCTDNHKISVGPGIYKKAGRLSTSDTLFFLSDSVCKETGKSEILHKKMYSELFSDAEVREDNRDAKMCSLRKAFRHSISVVSKTADLFQTVRLSLSNAAARGSRSIQAAYRAVPGLHKRNQKSGVVVTHENEQPYEQSGDACQSNVCYERQNFSGERRQRKDHTAAASIGRCPSDSYGSGNPNSPCENTVRQPALSLQSGFGRARTEGGNRSGWLHAYVEKMEVFRQTENSSAECSRVVGVTVLEPGDRSKSGFVCGESNAIYDLEVADNHNYLADGVLVSNCHSFRNYDSARTRNLLAPSGGFWRWSWRIWGLTGTPIVNSASDLWPLLSGPFHHDQTWWDFVSQFTEIKQGFNGPTPTGIKNPEGLAQILRPHVLRRTIESIGMKLPRLTVEQTTLDIDSGALATAMAGLSNWTPQRLQKALDENDEIKDDAMARVRHALGLAKVLPVATYAWHLMQAGERPLVIFFQHTAVREQLYNVLTHWGFKVSWIDGKITPAQLTAAESWFQEGKIDILLAQTQSAGQGLTLTRAWTCLIAEMAWTSVAVQQAVKRIHRIGQTKSCTAHVLRASGCWLEEVLSSVVSKKQKASEKLLNLLTTSK